MATLKRLSYLFMALAFLAALYPMTKALFQKKSPCTRLPISHLVSPLTSSQDTPSLKPQISYPPHVPQAQSLPPITKYHFLCKGSHNNPIVSHEIDGKTQFFQDCDGSHTHSLPLIDGEPGITPHLIELLNYAQNKCARAIRILEGHRCYKHQQYLSSKQSDLISLHQMGSAATLCFEASHNDDLQPLIEALLSWYEASSLKGSRISVNEDKTRWSNRYMRLTYQPSTDLPSTNYHGPHLKLEIRVDPSTGKPITYSYRKVRSNLIMY